MNFIINFNTLTLPGHSPPSRYLDNDIKFNIF